ncbi:formyltetrahydrofolate deformylase [Faunimonas pinastri]|uniref:Formyltetrahydrofolate deformylase n=1 Tax=Faunimonas pinastri TaxID=1855383 RepID=A0A1H9A0U1_9HYPH|nr:formyltetrahydrofolate deformylase [Faunimonas pinastri]SEP70117.1 formyltetrahydrofolate deformylase [Faunimonas pinastri]
MNAVTKAADAAPSASRPASSRFVLNLSCADQPGIVAGVSGTLANSGCNILESAQFGDPETDLFFMRVVFAPPEAVTVEDIQGALRSVAKRFSMEWTVKDMAVHTRVLIMVSRFDHCLQDLLYRKRLGALPIDIVAIVSNHEDSRPLAEANGIPFHHLPVTRDNKAETEDRILALVEETGAELVVLARYMQILSNRMSEALSGRVINIHHSFLPAFKGAKPYHQASSRGVKLIGATAHYVTADLDEGPIIEQDAERVTHADSAESLVAKGRDIEARVLARAVRYHVERRVFLNGIKTVVFS